VNAFVRFISSLESDPRDGGIAAEKLRSGSLEAQAPVHLEGRLPEHSAKNAVEVERRKRSLACQRVQIERLVQHPADAPDCALDCGLVERSRLRLHEKQSTERCHKPLDRLCDSSRRVDGATFPRSPAFNGSANGCIGERGGSI
jgi:hypothetical protein